MFLFEMYPRFLIKEGICVKQLTKWPWKLLILGVICDFLRKGLVLKHRTQTDVALGATSPQLYVPYVGVTVHVLRSSGVQVLSQAALRPHLEKQSERTGGTSITWQSVIVGTGLFYSTRVNVFSFIVVSIWLEFHFCIFPQVCTYVFIFYVLRRENPYPL